jgi:hypothetical protein
MPTTKKEYESLKQELERNGFQVLSKFRKNMKTIKLGDIVLSNYLQNNGK